MRTLAWWAIITAFLLGWAVRHVVGSTQEVELTESQWDELMYYQVEMEADIKDISDNVVLYGEALYDELVVLGGYLVGVSYPYWGVGEGVQRLWLDQAEVGASPYTFPWIDRQKELWTWGTPDVGEGIRVQWVSSNVWVDGVSGTVVVKVVEWENLPFENQNIDVSDLDTVTNVALAGTNGWHKFGEDSARVGTTQSMREAEFLSSKDGLTNSVETLAPTLFLGTFLTVRSLGLQSNLDVTVPGLDLGGGVTLAFTNTLHLGDYEGVWTYTRLASRCICVLMGLGAALRLLKWGIG